MASCSVSQINAPNGEPSQLYKDLLSKYDQDEATRLYVRAQSLTGAYSPETTDGNGELKADYLIGIAGAGGKSYNALAKANGDEEVSKDRFLPLVHHVTMRVHAFHEEASTLRGHSEGEYQKLAYNASQRKAKELELKTVRAMTTVNQLLEYGNNDIKNVQDLINSPRVSMKDVQYGKDTVRLWQNVMSMLSPQDVAELKRLSPELTFNMAAVSVLENKLSTLTKKMVLELITTTTQHELTPEEVFLAAHDLGFLKKQGVDVSRIDNPMAQTGWKLYLGATHRTRVETTALRGNLETLITKVSRQLTSKGGYMAFYGKTAKGYMTGDLVSRNTYEYEQDRLDYRNEAIRNNLDSDWKAYAKWNKDNSAMHDPRSVGADPQIQDYGKPMTAQEIQEHHDHMDDMLGKPEADKQRTETATKITRYTYHKAGAFADFELNWEARRETLLDKVTDPAEREEINSRIDNNIAADKDSWIKDNSPYVMNGFMKGEKGVKFPRNAEEHTMMIAGKEEHYDPRFKELMKNPDQAALYEMMIDTHNKLTAMMPRNTQEQVRRFGLPYLSKSKWEIFGEHPYQIASILDPLREAAGVSDQQQVSIAPRGPNGEEVRRLKASIVADHSVAAKDIAARMAIDFEVKNGRRATALEYREMKEKGVDELVRAGSLDLGNVMGHMIDSAVTYKYKSRIEDHMKILDSAIKEELRGFATNKAGEVLRDINGNKILKKDNVGNIQESFNHFIGKFYEEAKPVEGKAEEKWNWLLTGHERELTRDLKALKENVKADTVMTDDEKEARIATIDSQLANMGSYLSASRVGDMLMKYQIYKSLAWNPFSAVSNVLQGMFTNLVEGSAGVHYTNEELLKAFKLTGHSVAAFWTGGRVQSEVATKIRTLVEKFGMEAVSHGELGEVAGGSSWMSKFKSLDAMNMQARSEYLNQAPMLIAMMMHKKIMIEGKEVSVWDAYDSKGEWKHGENTDWNGDNNNMSHNKELINFEGALKNVLKSNHGNYDSLNSPLMAKEQFMGRALMMFRTWIFDMANTRVSDGWKDITDSSGIQDKKGFYRSVPEYYKANGGAIGTLVDVAHNLTRKLAFQNTTFEGKIGEKFTKTDAANMRRVFTEMATYMTMTAAYFGVKALMPDDNPSSKASRNILLNTMLRFQTDINFFVSPMSIQALNKNIIPITSIVNDFYKLYQDAIKAINGHGMTTTGPGKGGYPLLYDMLGMIPGAHQLNNLRANVNLMDGSTSKGH